MKRLAAALGLLVLTGSVNAQAQRQVQIRAVDFQNGVIEVFNFGTTNVGLDGWRFCSHDFNEAFQYTAATGLNGVTIESRTSVYIHLNDNAPAGNPDRINRSTLGGGFATPLDQDAFGMQLFFPDVNGNVSFGNSAQIADHIQWNIAGQGIGSAETRTAQAVGQGLWNLAGAFIATQTNSIGIALTDLSGDAAGSPSEYTVVAPPSIHNELLNGDLSDSASAPTPLNLASGSNIVTAQVNLSNDLVLGDRDFFTFTVPAGQVLSALNLLAWTPDNLGFLAVNSGNTGFVPSGATDASFLAGVLVSTGDVGTNLMTTLDTGAVTINNLPQPQLAAGTYTLVVQQTSNVFTDYALEFVLTGVPSCPADFNGVDGVTVQDIFAFLAAWFAGSPSADFNGVGGITVQDIFAFLAAWFARC